MNHTATFWLVVTGGGLQLAGLVVLVLSVRWLLDRIHNVGSSLEDGLVGLRNGLTQWASGKRALEGDRGELRFSGDLQTKVKRAGAPEWTAIEQMVTQGLTALREELTATLEAFARKTETEFGRLAIDRSSTQRRLIWSLGLAGAGTVLVTVAGVLAS